MALRLLGSRIGQWFRGIGFQPVKMLQSPQARSLSHVGVIALIFAGGCEIAPRADTTARSVETQPASQPVLAESDSETKSYPRQVIDGLERTVTLPQRPERIVSLAPKNTEELF